MKTYKIEKKNTRNKVHNEIFVVNCVKEYNVFLLKYN